jgi:methanogenic corrinoid protein MtbC1
LRLIEVEVVPRLLGIRAQDVAAEIVAPPTGLMVTHDIVEEFTQLVLVEDAAVAGAYVDVLRTQGARIETIYVDLLAQTARHLGSLWDEDLVDFAQVTVGLWRLQQVLVAFSPDFQSEDPRPANGQNALMVCAAGEQHSFGLVMIEEFMRRAGWNLRGGPGLPLNSLGRLVTDEWFTLVCYSLGCDDKLTDLVRSIQLIRKVSQNRHVRVMVGGPLFIKNPELVAQVGADGTAADARGAVIEAEKSIPRHARGS